MRYPSRLTALLALGGLATASFGMSMILGGGDFDMDWFSIDSGGGIASGGDFTIHGTIGQWDAGIPLSGGDFTLTGGFWAAGAEPPTTTPATLVDFDIAFGSHIAGGLAQLTAPDGDTLDARSQFGFSAQEPNILQLRIGAETTVSSPSDLTITVKSRLNNSGGTARVRLRNWSTNQFEEIHAYATGLNETTEVVENIDPTNRVRTADGRIELAHHQFVVATFSASGFDGFFDWIEILVK